MLKKTLIYLGLGPDEEYDQYDEYAPERAAGGQFESSTTEARPTVRAASGQPAPRPRSTTVRPVPASPTPSGSVRAVPGKSSSTTPARRAPAPAEAGQVASAVRIVESPSAKPHALSPTSFNEAQAIGDRFKAGRAVIINLQGVDRDLRRRLVDFASGLCYAVGGKMDRVADQVYLLTPPDVEVSASDAQRALD